MGFWGSHYLKLKFVGIVFIFYLFSNPELINHFDKKNAAKAAWKVSQILISIKKHTM